MTLYEVVYLVELSFLIKCTIPINLTYPEVGTISPLEVEYICQTGSENRNQARHSQKITNEYIRFRFRSIHRGCSLANLAKYQADS